MGHSINYLVTNELTNSNIQSKVVELMENILWKRDYGSSDNWWTVTERWFEGDTSFHNKGVKKVTKLSERELVPFGIITRDIWISGWDFYTYPLVYADNKCLTYEIGDGIRNQVFKMYLKHLPSDYYVVSIDMHT